VLMLEAQASRRSGPVSTSQSLPRARALRGGWRPPPKPGLIPLRPLGFGTLLGASFQVLRRNPKPVFGSALLIQVLILVITLIIVGTVGFFSFARIFDAPQQDQDTLIAGAFALTGLSSIIPFALAIIASAALQGIIVVEVARGTLGEKLKFRGLWRAMRPALWGLVRWTLLVGAVILLAFLVLAAIVALGVAVGGAAIGIGIGIAVLGILAMAVLGVWIGTKVSLVPSLLVLERLTVRMAIRRSWMLTNGFFWRTFGIQILANAIVSVAGQVVSFPLSIVFSLVASVLLPNGDTTDFNGDSIGPFIALYIGFVLLSGLVSAIFGAITSIVQSGAVALIYIDLRMRKEGLDLDLQRYVENGRTGPDPYAETISRNAPPKSAYSPYSSAGPEQSPPPAPPYSEPPVV
jgi:hypothetical protein